MNIYYHKKVGINIKQFWKEILKIFPAFIIPLFVGILFVIYQDINQPFYFVLGIGIYSLLFIISMWFIGMNQYERDLIKVPLNAFFKRIKGDKDEFE